MTAKQTQARDGPKVSAYFKGIKIKKSLLPWTVSDCAIATGRDEDVSKLNYDGRLERIISIKFSVGYMAHGKSVFYHRCDIRSKKRDKKN